MSVVENVLNRVPEPLRSFALRHRELVKFAFVGGSAFLIDNLVFYTLKLSVLSAKPVTAKVIAVLVATIFSYVLNREWSFRTRGGRDTPHEAALFFLVSGVGVVINTAPLYISRYVFDLQVPEVSRFTQEVADFSSGQIIGTLIGMGFRWWAFRRFVFPQENVRARPTIPSYDQDPPAEEEPLRS
ncbi:MULTISPECIES: GtrA family protein [Actinoalloteichus]|uniref:GtrA family protein n=1 Tax=Actinoalloteichus TaxID=65496 RepID=UPI0009512A02|nr:MULTISPECIES: GtrA family protein [Actinoalloteichus]